MGVYIGEPSNLPWDTFTLVNQETKPCQNRSLVLVGQNLGKISDLIAFLSDKPRHEKNLLTPTWIVIEHQNGNLWLVGLKINY